MIRIPMLPLFAAACCAMISSRPASGAPANKIFDQELTMLERELVPLAEAMPADKYGFAPTQGEFKGVRTFGQQISHIAAVMYMVSASVLGEKVPTEAGEGENGPASLKTKDDIVKYLKSAVAYSHKAMNSLTDANLTAMVKSPFGEGDVPRVSMASVVTWHSFDHYGQMAVYARMNGIIPPASRQ
jgi:hypothetical protein